MRKRINFIIALLLFGLAGCITDGPNQKTDIAAMAGKWRLVSKTGNITRDMGSTITLNENGSWTSSGLSQSGLKGGRFVVEGKKLRMLSLKKKKELEDAWTIVNANTMEQKPEIQELPEKTENAEDEESTSAPTESVLRLERIK